MKEPKCRGEVKPPEMSAECKARCNAHVQGHAECSPAKVTLHIEGAADVKVAEQYKAALEKNLPLVLKVAIGLGEASVKMAGNVHGVIEGVEASVKGSGNAVSGAQLAACVAEPFSGALKAAGSIKANVSVSVDVKASASGSASGHT
jgi:hypothetical protein